MFSISACFRKSQKSGLYGSVYYVIRQGSACRNITGNIKGLDKGIMAEAKNEIAFDLMTIYCVIENLLEKNKAVTLSEITQAVSHAILIKNPYEKRIKDFGDKFPVNDEVATIPKLFADKFVRKRIEDNYALSGLLGYFSGIIHDYRTAGKAYAKSLRNTQLSIANFTHNINIPLPLISSQFILDYNKFLKERVSASTASFYIRVLRFVIRRAEKEGVLSTDFRWPSAIKTTVSRTTRISENNALDIATIRCIEQLDLSNDKTLELARDIFMFGFYAQGMELKDIANLKLSNLNGDTLSYRRRQTGHLKDVIIGHKALCIINKYMDSGNDYIFPLFSLSRKYSYSTVQTKISAYLKEISRLLELPFNLTFNMNIYSWKHIIHSSNISEILIC